MKLSCSLFILYCLSGSAVELGAQYNFNVIRTFGETNHKIVYASYNHDGSYIITAGSDSSIIIWNAERRTTYRTITGLKGRPAAIAFSPDNEFVFSGGSDNKVSMWDIKPMVPVVVRTFEGHAGQVKSFDISPDGRYLATGSTEGIVSIWDLNSTDLIFELKRQNKEAVNTVAFSPDGKILVSGSADGEVSIWNVTDGTNTGSRSAQKKGIQRIVFSPDGKLLASCGYDKDIVVFHLPGLDNPVIMKGHKDWVQTMDFSPDNKCLMSGGRDGYIILWDVASGNILQRSEKQPGIVMFLDFNPARAGFISTNYQSEEIRTWVLSGFDEAQWKRPAEFIAARITAPAVKAENQQKPLDQPETKIKQVETDIPASHSMIEIFSPVPSQGKVVHDKNSILLVGRVSDPRGINTFLINKNKVTLSEGGVFQFSLELVKGENEADIVAINNSGVMDNKKLIIDCTSQNAVAAGAGTPEIARGKYYALLIGIDDYQSDEIADLTNPVNDAENLRNVLLSKYTFEKENIILLKNPKLSEIMITFDDLVNKIGENDNLLIFYAGHGWWDDKGKVGYWLPSDASRNNTVNWFRNSTLRDYIGSIQTKHTILIADACFSGAIFKSRAAFADTPKGIEKLYELPSRKAMTSGILQEVPDESQFIKYLIRRLDENTEKFLPSEILFSTFKTAVMNNSPNVPQYGVIQNVGDEGGDFIFIKR